MPGAGGLVAANWMAKLAPQDGTTLFMIAQPHAPGQALALPNIQFDVRAFHWIGNTIDTPNVVNAWHTSGVRTIEDAMKRELVLGGTTGTNSVVYPAVLNALVGTRFKVVTGYPGGGELNLAMERGEIQGRGSNSWAAWKSTKQQWLAENKIIILVQIALKRAPDLPEVPLLLELAKNDFDRKVLTFLSADTAISARVTTPNCRATRRGGARIRRHHEGQGACRSREPGGDRQHRRGGTGAVRVRAARSLHRDHCRGLLHAREDHAGSAHPDRGAARRRRASNDGQAFVCAPSQPREIAVGDDLAGGLAGRRAAGRFERHRKRRAGADVLQQLQAAR